MAWEIPWTEKPGRRNRLGVAWGRRTVGHNLVTKLSDKQVTLIDSYKPFQLFS